MPVRHYLGPWAWDTSDAAAPTWRGPTGTVAAVDLATPDQCGQTVNPAARGVGYFAANTPAPLGVEYTLLGAGADPRGITADAAVVSAWRSATGYAPTGPHLAALLADHLTAGADPAGSAACLPLVPEDGRRLRLYLAGTRVVDQPFSWGDAYTVTLRALLRRDFRRLFLTAQAGQLKDPQHHRRVLGYWLRQYRIADWREFVPPDLQGDVPGELPPETTLTDSFTHADVNPVAGSLTWTVITGAVETVSNTARTNGFATVDLARADSDLSAADHYAQAIMTASEDSALATPSMVVRKDSSATQTYYRGELRFLNDNVRLSKVVAAAVTTLATSGVVTLTAGTLYTTKLSVTGSSLDLLIGGVSQVTATDTAVTGNLRCGLDGRKSTSGYVQWDDFEASDGAGGAKARTPNRRPTRIWGRVG